MNRQGRHLLCQAIILFALSACSAETPDNDRATRSAPVSPVPIEFSTANYTIASTAEAEATQRAGRAVEALYGSYVGFIGEPAPGSARSPLMVRLYRNRDEFLANSRSRPWAEAYYAEGVCHAYVDPDKANPYHWLLHEAVHQLNRELKGIARERWLNEGLASYFGSSRYADGRLELGVPDMDAYPLWWLERWELSGDWATDVRNQRVVPLRALITGQGGPPMDDSVNAHYLGWWSLTHFLLHYDEGRYAAGYRRLLEQDGSLAAFEQHIGPVERIEAEWYAYFQMAVRAAKNGSAKAEFNPPGPGDRIRKSEVQDFQDNTQRQSPPVIGAQHPANDHGADDEVDHAAGGALAKQQVHRE